MHHLSSYLQFLLKSTNQHGVHSPFVYDLVTKCFYDRTNYQEYKTIEAYRRNLLQNNELITITDFGAGSKVFKSNNRRINAIAKTSGTSLKHAKLLFRLARYFQPSTLLELGTNLGIGTYAMALGHPVGTVTTIEGCQSLVHVAQQNLANNNLQNITIRHGQFDTEIQQLHTTSWDLIFFDGDHSKASTLAYFEALLPKAHNNSLFIFDDIYWSKDMTEAWCDIKAHPQVSVSIDLFFWGLIFFRKEQAKEHFNIRV